MFQFDEIITPDEKLDDLPEEYAAVETRTILLDLARARQLLERNIEPQKGVEGTNRRSSQVKIVDHQREMANVKWLLTHQGLAVDINGNLVDGGHRLKAFIAAVEDDLDLVIPTLLTINLPIGSMSRVDLGKRRTLQDELHRRGHTDTYALGAAVNLIWAYQNHDRSQQFLSTHWKMRPHRDLVLQMVADDPLIVEGVRVSGAAKLVTRSAFSAAWYLIAKECGGHRLDEFCDLVIEGQHIGQGNPVWAMRRLLINDREAKRRAVAHEHLAYMITAYDEFVNSIPRNLMYFRAGQRFPILPRISDDMIKAEEQAQEAREAAKLREEQAARDAAARRDV